VGQHGIPRPIGNRPWPSSLAGKVPEASPGALPSSHARAGGGFRPPNAVVNTPFGRAIGGAISDPNLLSLSERKKLTRLYTSEIMEFLGPERDVFTHIFLTATCNTN
jgi:hypothetical protein